MNKYILVYVLGIVTFPTYSFLRVAAIKFYWIIWRKFHPRPKYSDPIGKITSVTEDDKGLRVKLVFNDEAWKERMIATHDAIDDLQNSLLKPMNPEEKD